MEEVHLFSLEQHSGPYEQWPLRSRLFINQEACDTCVPGYVLLRQFKTADGYLLITDCDCPYEEATSFILLDEHYKIQSCRTLAFAYASFNFDDIVWRDSRNALVSFWKADDWHLRIREYWLPNLIPRLQLKRINSSASKRYE
jgi:hypothetical protein